MWTNARSFPFAVTMEDAVSTLSVPSAVSVSASSPANTAIGLRVDAGTEETALPPAGVHAPAASGGIDVSIRLL